MAAVNRLQRDTWTGRSLRANANASGARTARTGGRRPAGRVYDLGSGDGRIRSPRQRSWRAGVGIEIDPVLVAQAQANAREAGVEDKVEFRLGDMYAADVRAATVVTLFLHPGPNLKLREKLRSDLQPGARIVSYVWDMGSWPPADVRQVNSHRIFLWRIPPR